MLGRFLVSLGILVVLDGLWLGLVMADFYRRHLAHLARLADGRLDPVWPIAALVYPVLALGITVFVLDRAQRPLDALALGALFGSIAFAVYDLTNHATLRDWRTVVTVVDIGWGAFSCGVTAWAVSLLVRP